MSLTFSALGCRRTITGLATFGTLNATSRRSVCVIVIRTIAETLIVEEEQVLRTRASGTVLSAHRTGHTDRATGLTVVVD